MPASRVVRSRHQQPRLGRPLHSWMRPLRAIRIWRVVSRKPRRYSKKPAAVVTNGTRARPWR